MRRQLGFGGTLMVIAAFLMLAAASCSSGSTSSSDGAAATTPPASPSPSPSVTATQGGGGSTTASIQAGAGGFVFSPSTVSIAAGGKLTVKNVGTIPHTFTIQSNNINQVMTPGQSATITINLAPGTYPFVCMFHQSSGMKGTLTVT